MSCIYNIIEKKKKPKCLCFNINLDKLFSGLFYGGGEVKLPPILSKEAGYTYDFISATQSEVKLTHSALSIIYTF